MTRLLHVAGLATTLISPSPAAVATCCTCGAGIVGAAATSDTGELVPR